MKKSHKQTLLLDNISALAAISVVMYKGIKYKKEKNVSL